MDYPTALTTLKGANLHDATAAERATRIKCCTIVAQHVLLEATHTPPPQSFLHILGQAISVLVRSTRDDDVTVSLVASEKLTLLVKRFTTAYPTKVSTTLVKALGAYRACAAFDHLAFALLYVPPDTMSDGLGALAEAILKVLRLYHAHLLQVYATSSKLLFSVVAPWLTIDQYHALWMGDRKSVV